ncbi:hypothetical protein PENSPDRAFT_441334 [Peniophora sp. CONT]|nr:hypothetical protein PENSPDRAFT_441334 [Peniophora sp. CONT]
MGLHGATPPEALTTCRPFGAANRDLWASSLWPENGNAFLTVYRSLESTFWTRLQSFSFDESRSSSTASAMTPANCLAFSSLIQRACLVESPWPGRGLTIPLSMWVRSLRSFAASHMLSLNLNVQESPLSTQAPAPPSRFPFFRLLPVVPGGGFLVRPFVIRARCLASCLDDHRRASPAKGGAEHEST